LQIGCTGWCIVKLSKRMSAVIGSSDFRILPTSSKAKISSVNEVIQLFFSFLTAKNLLQDCERDIIWYRDNFFGKGRLKSIPIIRIVHMNFIATVSVRGPLAISLIKDGDVYKCLIRSTAGSEVSFEPRSCELKRLSVSVSSIKTSFLRRLFGIGPSHANIFLSVSRNIPTQELKVCFTINVL
jgi:RAP1 GTPase activating protein 1